MTLKINARQFRVLLAEKGLNQKDVAQMSGVGESTIVRLLSGASFRTETLDSLSKALGVNPLDLLDVEDAPDPLVDASAAVV